MMTESSAPQNAAEVEAVITPTLDVFVAGCAPTLRKVADDIYEQLLNSVEDYLKSNAVWNIGSEIDRCRAIEADNRKLRAINLELKDALSRVLNAHRYDGALTMGSASLSPAIEGMVERAIAVATNNA